ncbi:MAG TPA: sigma-54 dependent transcriptional regulator [Longimicrobiales bacterium]|nr:sigma-54 dependent transcriptional regulator [Longimicrobiales bacterium]
MKDDIVLISTHDLNRAGSLREAFHRAGYGTDLVTPAEALTSEGTVLLVLTGGFESGGGGLARQAREVLHIPVFALAPGESLSPALRPGFDEVFAGSVTAADVAAVGRMAIERRRLQRLTGIVGKTDAVREVLERVVQIAPVASTVLVTGESGTGKELVARGIHGLSPRRHKPFIAVNVAALSETLLESELFGHEKGAFTGAIDARRGLFELADKGTIFLDEIGEMPLATQTKLLRVLEQREFHRVGGERAINVDVRIVAATNQDLRQLVAIGEFRRDLYFRLNVLHIELPALRDRRDDIDVLVEEFIRDASVRHDRSFAGISPEAMEILRDYSWPGNVRELRNLVESMVVLAPGGVIGPQDIPGDVLAGRGRTLLPAQIPRGLVEGGQGKHLHPELEFVFRTLMDLRVDMDDLRRQFEVYRRDASMDVAARAVGRLPSREIPIYPLDVAEGDDEVREVEAVVQPMTRTGMSDDQGSAKGADGIVIYRPGMTMEDMEREAIRAALESVAGNRRKAAELLGIGERTLYRKISKFEMD